MRVAGLVRQAILLQPDDALVASRLAPLSGFCPVQSVDDVFFRAVLHLSSHPAVDPQDVEPLASKLLTHLELDGLCAAWDRAHDPLLSHPLLLHLLEDTVITRVDVQEHLQRLQRHIPTKRDHWTSPQLRLAAALAQQAFNVEHVWPGDAPLFPVTSWEDFLCLALWRPPSSLPAAPVDVPAELAGLLRRTVMEPLAEAHLKRIFAAQDEADAVSHAVRSLYEESPYPRWLRMGHHEMRPWDAHLRSVLPHAKVKPLKHPKVLVAGCGTGHHALLVSRRIQGAHVTAVDLSSTSLAYAARMAHDLGGHNITFQRANILDLPKMGTFDVVESVGVLHHLENPLAGWAALVDVLRPGGWMCVGLYSQAARQPVVEAREWLKTQGHLATAADVKRGRAALLAHGPQEAVMELVRSPDFHAASGCRDLLFHVQEHRFTPLQVAASLDELGLAFRGMEMVSPELLAEFDALFPQDTARTNLAHWAELETQHPGAFAAMMVFWCQKRG